MKKYLMIIALLLNSITTIGQDNFLDSYSIHAQSGWVLPTNDFVRGNNNQHTPISLIYATSFRYERQTDGSRPWHQLYDYPSYGLGLYIADFNVKNQLGKPIALYGFMSSYVINKPKWSLKAEFSLGLAFNWQHFSLENPFNDVMGASLSCYIDAGLSAYRLIGSKFEIGVGLSLSHFSNGAMAKPNKGLNVITPKLSLKYKPYGAFEYAQTQLPTFNSTIEDLTTIFIGSHNVLTILPKEEVDKQYNKKSYLVFGLDKRFLKRFTYKHSFGIGFGLGYNQYIGTTYYVENREIRLRESNLMERFNLNAYLSYEYKIHKLHLFIEPGYYIYRSIYDEAPNFFQRIGLRYQINKNWFCSIGLRAQHFSVAQYIEWGIGLRM
ncbi:MAG: acyloxyacyl hydrolase [Bacteroidales bacterium]|jgi:hypothetical protein|nr:acyloxyacyl hydrolase [Bacteroidales bacterium]